MRKNGVLCLLALALASCSEHSETNYIQWVDTMIGTGAHYSADAAELWGNDTEQLMRKQKPLPTSKRGNMGGYDLAHDPGQCIPAVLSPHGMNFWVAQTQDTEQKGIAPYYYADEEIQGFRGSHWLTGSMTQDYGSFTLMPLGKELITNPIARGSRFSHEDEISTPAYYSVELLDYGICAEMTATSRTALFCFTYHTEGDVYLVVNPNSDEAQGSVKYDAENHRIVGSNPVHRIYQGKGEYAGFDGHFVVEIDKDILAGGVYAGNEPLEGEISVEKQPGVGAWVKYHVEKGERVLVRAASSFTDVEGALANLRQEAPHYDFDQMHRDLTDQWEEQLGVVEARTSNTDHLTQFYTALYHASFLPHVVSDCDGRYPSFAGGAYIRQKEEGSYYDDYSMWDTYRALHPLQVLLYPERAGEMVQSLIDKYDDGGWLPIFPCWNSYTSEMIGDHCCSLVADAWFKGVRNFDIDKAYNALVQNATTLPASRKDYVEGKGRRALDSYLQYGYIPLEDSVADAYHQGEQTSRTLEYAYDDYLLSLLASDRGDQCLGDSLFVRSLFYRNVFNRRMGCVDGRHADGSWEWGDPLKFQPYITEGRPCHYMWYVPHDVVGLVSLMGGRSLFSSKLDSLFATGNYWHGNEPCHHIAYLYDYVGRSQKTQQRVHDILLNEYGLSPDGLSGNDDAGQMSAWYIFSALGFYPVCPGTTHYALGTPLFEEAILHLPSGNDFRIVAHGVSAENYFVERAEINGLPLHEPFLRHQEIVQGGILELFMSPTPR